jgi:hypothetical protein
MHLIITVAAYNFVKAMIYVTAAGAGNTPTAFYEKFYWGNIVNRAVNFIS